MGETEFFEGVRCLLVDRKDTPKWRYAQTKDISDAEVNKYFEPLSDSSKELVL